jgi:hypothetical protein
MRSQFDNRCPGRVGHPAVVGSADDAVRMEDSDDLGS